MFRLWYLAFLGESRNHDAHPHESPWSMLGPLVILAVLSLIGGWIGIERFGAFLRLCNRAHDREARRAHLELILSIVAVAVALLGWLVADLFYGRSRSAPRKLAAALPGTYKLLSTSITWTRFYGATVVKPLLAISNVRA